MSEQGKRPRKESNSNKSLEDSQVWLKISNVVKVIDVEIDTGCLLVLLVFKNINFYLFISLNLDMVLG